MFGIHPMPELVFMDIHLADGSAFEIFDHISITCPIIFTTAYDEYALRAFKVNSIDYLLKPIGKEDIEHAFEKLDNLQDTIPENGSRRENKEEELLHLIHSLKKQENYKTHFLIPIKGDKLLPVLDRHDSTVLYQRLSGKSCLNGRGGIQLFSYAG